LLACQRPYATRQGELRLALFLPASIVLGEFRVATPAAATKAAAASFDLLIMQIDVRRKAGPFDCRAGKRPIT